MGLLPPGSQSDAGAAATLDLPTVVALLWRRRWWVLAVAVLSGIAGLVWAARAEEWFRAEVVLVGVEGSGALPASGALGGLISLSGISLSQQGGRQVPLATLQSRELARQFISGQGIQSILLSEMQPPWWRRLLALGRAPKFDDRDVTRYFLDHVRFVNEDRRAGLITLAMEWRSAELAATWAGDFAAAANRSLREQALAESQRNIDFLRSEISKTSVPSLQQSLSKVLESEMQKYLMARGNAEYAFKVIDRAVPPRSPVRPRQAFIVLSCLIAGFSIAAAGVLLRGLADARRAG